ncbi:G-protein coupled receptor Mth2-like [Hyalella azteca]|uniref:G-protein coupled receptor Mth2-like n=1 Tax=Hyalella azteca TaxID=294128 RepID=A0A8B7PLP9_HYAAZ|nr:G-protein coupled receptor Mth2-like [Hyalella azteca]
MKKFAFILSISSYLLAYIPHIASQSGTLGNETISFSNNTTDYGGGDEYYSSDDSAIEGQWNNTKELAQCENSTCVRKCCPEGQFFSLHGDAFGCINSSDEVPKFEVQFRFKDGRPTYPDKPLELLTGMKGMKPGCTQGVLPEHRRAELLSDGQLYTAYDQIFRNHSEYCLDVIRRDDEHFGMWYITCYDEYEETPRSIFRFYSHSIFLTLSCVALSVIIVCHVSLPQLRDLSGMCLLSHVTSLFVADLALVTVTLWRSISVNLCVFFGVVIHSGFIATYMWLTIMCFDIWRYVRLSVKGIPSNLLQQEEKRLFGFYSLAVWGSVLLITIVTCTLQFLPKNALPDYIIRPQFGVNRCFIIEEDHNLLVYFFLILAVLCILNICFVGMTVNYLYQGGARICCFQRSLACADSVVFNNKQLDLFWQRFQIFVMTICIWSTEVLSWKIPPKELWDATDLLNTLQGVILLIIFMRAKRKRDLILTQVRKFAGIAHSAAQKLSRDDDTSMTSLETHLSKQGSDKETIDKIRKLSRQEETVSSTIVKSLAQSKILAEDARSPQVQDCLKMNHSPTQQNALHPPVN